jgi:hypothetical protein
MSITRMIKSYRHFNILDFRMFYIFFIYLLVSEEFEDTKEVIRIRKSKKNRQHNGQKKKNRQHHGQKKKRCCLSFCPFSVGHCVVFVLWSMITPLVSWNFSYEMVNFVYMNNYQKPIFTKCTSWLSTNKTDHHHIIEICKWHNTLIAHYTYMWMCIANHVFISLLSVKSELKFINLTPSRGRNRRSM